MQTTTQSKAFATAVKLARLAMPDNGATDSERESAASKLADHCAKHNLPLADILAAAASPDTVKPKPQAKPADTASEAPKAKRASAKPEKPTKPHTGDAKRAAEYAERVALINALRASVARIYNGPSLAVRSNPKRINASIYADLIAAPKHRTTLARVSVRDESALAEIITRGDAAGCFDPVALNLDAGIFSRLASIAFIEPAPKSAKLPYRLSKAGAEHARKAAKRAA